MRVGNIENSSKYELFFGLGFSFRTYLVGTYLSKILASANYFLDLVSLRVGNIENSSICELFPGLVFFFGYTYLVLYLSKIRPSSNYFLDVGFEGR